FSSRRRHTRSKRDWSSDVCSSDLGVLDEPWAAGEKVFPLARGEGVVDGGTNHLPYLEGRIQLVLQCEIGIDGVAEVCLPVPDQGDLGDEERLVSAHSRQNVVEERLYRVRVLDVRMNVDPLELGSLPDECHPAFGRGRVAVGEVEAVESSHVQRGPLFAGTVLTAKVDDALGDGLVEIVQALVTFLGETLDEGLIADCEDVDLVDDVR